MKTSPHAYATLLMSWLGVFLALATPSRAQDTWLNWRGPHQNGTAAPGEYPLKWSEDSHIAWKVALPERGASTPLVTKDWILVTLGNLGKNWLVALNHEGVEGWRVELGNERAGKHGKASGSNSSPVSNGESVFAYFKSGDLACCALDGTVRWRKNLQAEFGEDTLWWDLGTSPVLAEGLILIAVMQSGPSYIAAFHQATGELAWKSDRTLDVNNESNQSYTTPMVAEWEGTTVLLTLGADHLTAHRIRDGQELWRIGGFNPENHGLFRSIASPVVAGDIVICPYARGDSLTGVRLSKEHPVVWQINKVGDDVPTPAVHGERAYVVSDKGAVLCLQPSTGKVWWKEELPKSRFQFSSSPIVANGYVYAIREDGTTFVFRDGDAFELVATNAIDGMVVATPVFFQNRILIRTLDALFCVQP